MSHLLAHYGKNLSGGLDLEKVFGKVVLVPTETFISHEALIAARKAAGLTQLEAADQIGVTDRTISNIENGGGTHVSTLALLARLYGVPVEQFIESRETTKPADPTASQADGDQRARFEEDPSNGVHE